MTRELSLLFYAALFVVALDALQKYEKCINPYGLNGTCVTRHECPELKNVSLYDMIHLYGEDTSCGLQKKLVCCGHPKYDLQKYEKCTNPYGLNGTCVALHECPELYNLSTSKYGIDLLYVTESYCGLDDEILVCCGHPGHVQLTNVDVNSLLGNKECGIAKEKPRIDGGRGEIGEFPWVVALIRVNIEKIQCAGALINNEYVLTTASCISNYLIFVKLGEWNNSTDPDCVDLVANKFCADPVKIIGIKETIVHPLFGIYTGYYDVGLIRLEEKVIFTDFIAPICLPHSKYITRFPEALGPLTLAGWNHTEVEPYSHFLVKLTIDVLSDYECWKKHRSESLFGTDRHSFCTKELDAKQLCTWGQIYFGGPFMKSYDESNGVVWYIHGIANDIYDCRENLPTVAAVDVSHYVDWIVKTTIAYSKIGL